MPLPNTPTFTPLDPLPASKLTDLVENDEALQDWSAYDAGTLPDTLIADGSLPLKKIGSSDELVADFVVSGGVWSGDAYASTLNASMTALVCYINGQRGTISAVTARAFTASKDTYIDVLNNSGTFSLVYTEVSNNAASPALAANSLRLAIVVTGGSNIAGADRINNGNFGATYPSVSGAQLATIDSIGNPIGRRDPITDTFLRQGLASSPAPTVAADIAASVITLNMAKAGNVDIEFGAHFQLNSGGNRELYYRLKVDGVSVKQCFGRDNPGATETHYDLAQTYGVWLAAGSHTINVDAVSNSGGSTAIDSGWLRVKTRAY